MNKSALRALYEAIGAFPSNKWTETARRLHAEIGAIADIRGAPKDLAEAVRASRPAASRSTGAGGLFVVISSGDGDASRPVCTSDNCPNA